MEELIIIVIILIVIFGIGTIQVPPVFDFPQQPQDVGTITGNETANFIEEGDLNLDFRGQISGNATVNIQSRRGNLYLRFREQITGNSTVNLKTQRGDIFVGFDKFIEGNPKVRIESGGDVVFANNRSEIQGYINRNLLEIRANGRIYYGDDSFFRHFRSRF